jgi:hypothetical protein
MPFTSKKREDLNYTVAEASLCDVSSRGCPRGSDSCLHARKTNTLLPASATVVTQMHAIEDRYN